MTGDFLNHLQRHTSPVHLRCCGAAEAVGTRSLNLSAMAFAARRILSAESGWMCPLKDDLVVQITIGVD